MHRRCKQLLALALRPVSEIGPRKGEVNFPCASVRPVQVSTWISYDEHRRIPAPEIRNDPYPEAEEVVESTTARCLTRCGHVTAITVGAFHHLTEGLVMQSEQCSNPQALPNAGVSSCPDTARAGHVRSLRPSPGVALCQAHPDRRCPRLPDHFLDTTQTARARFMG